MYQFVLQDNTASSTVARLASTPGASQAQFFSKDVQQKIIRLNPYFNILPVYS
jgi:hypothetical protein